jgi:hypothetical protein
MPSQRAAPSITDRGRMSRGRKEIAGQDRDGKRCHQDNGVLNFTS